MEREPFIKVVGIDKTFVGVKALRNVSFDVYPGERLTLVGENGSGKSTIIKIIAGALAPDAGSIIVDGRTYDHLSPAEAIHQGIQVIYQDFSLFPNLTVAENLAFDGNVAAGRHLMNWRQADRLARQAVDRIGMELPLRRLAGELTTADRQLVAIAKSLMRDARLIIMDEPTTALTRHEVAKLLSLVDDLKQQGIATVFVSHKLEEVLQISDRAVVLRNGEKVMESLAADLTRASLVETMSGIRLQEYAPPPPKTDETPLLEVDGLTVPGALDDISFAIHPGETMGLCGLRGSGRTELALSLFGLQPIGSGTIRMNGKPIRLRSVGDALRHRIALVPEDRLREGLFIDKSIAVNLSCRVLDRLRRRCGLIDRMAQRVHVDRWVRDLNIKTSDPGLSVSSLSGGNQQKVVLAKWLATDPRLLILNNPTAGVDIRSKMEINQLIRRLADAGMTLLVISDDLSELMQIANRIMVMKSGRIVAEFAAASATEGELENAVVGGEAAHA